MLMVEAQNRHVPLVGRPSYQWLEIGDHEVGPVAIDVDDEGFEQSLQISPDLETSTNCPANVEAPLLVMKP
jgi:hypothetical protein